MTFVPAQIAEAMLVHAENCHPEESCGLLAADPEGHLRMAYPLTNELHSPTNYTIAPNEHFRAIRHAEAQGWEICGVFHSHPHTQAYPSPTDVRLAPDPGWLYVVIGMEGRSLPVIRGFRIVSGDIHEEALTIGERNTP
ncbi:MAG: M67 family metallopeptidase [Acidimicrobiia bacterium]